MLPSEGSLRSAHKGCQKDLGFQEENDQIPSKLELQTSQGNQNSHHLGASKIIQLAKEIAPKPDDLNSATGAQMVEGEDRLLQAVL